MPQRRVALINNAGSYVGPTLARHLAKSGHDLVLSQARPGLVEEVQDLGASVELLSTLGETKSDSGKTAQSWQEIMDRTITRFGRLDAAALFPPTLGTLGFTKGPFLSATIEQMHDMTSYFDTTLYALQATIRAMQKTGGQILVFTSDAGARPEANWSLYGAARAGQSFLVQAVALEHAKDGISINVLGSKNAVFQGFPDAPSASVTDSTVTPGEWSKPLEAETPLGRLGTMEELASFAHVLLDGTNKFQTANYFSYSGGWHAM